jgi:RES domain-containing protein
MYVQGFPQWTIPPGTPLYRIHRAVNGVWFFGNADDYRFDLTGSPSHGTCYFAEEPLGAFVETLQSFRGTALPRPELAARRMFTVAFDQPLTLADVTHNDAGSFGLDASIFAGTADRYDAGQAFALRAFASGYAGVRYRVRHDMSQDLLGVALFGPAGSHIDADMPTGTDEDIPESVINDACIDIGFRVRGPLLEPV